MEARQQYKESGYLVVRGLFTPSECNSMLDHFMDIMDNQNGGGFAEETPDKSSEDPLKRYPRLLHPHRKDHVALEWMLDERIGWTFEDLLGQQPLAVQTMVYYKPPGSLGQARHQDNRYLRANPGTCHGAWLALEDTDESNGCLNVVPGSHALPILCPTKSDPRQSWTKDVLPVPPGLEEISIPMQKGDILFFHGNLIHGSYLNRSATRFRRIIAAHYIQGDALQVAEFYHPVFQFGGGFREVGSVKYGGGKCGYLREDGTVDETGEIERAVAAH